MRIGAHARTRADVRAKRTRGPGRTQRTKADVAGPGWHSDDRGGRGGREDRGSREGQGDSDPGLGGVAFLQSGGRAPASQDPADDEQPEVPDFAPAGAGRRPGGATGALS